MGKESFTLLLKFLDGQKISFRVNARLKEFTTFKLGGPCPCMVHCEKPKEVINVISELVKNRIKFILIGDGSNLLISDKGISAVVIRYSSKFPMITLSKDRVIVSGSTNLDSFVQFTVEQGIGGFVNCSGIPGTVGGAIGGNAGAFGWDLSQSLESLGIIDENARTKQIKSEDCGFSYRNSHLCQKGNVVVEATFRVEACSKNELTEQRKSILELRSSKHPNLKTNACAGSFFKNIKPTSAADRRQAAGRFLEQAGAKIMQIGGAGVYEKHANIIVQKRKDCTAQDVFNLSSKLARLVKNKFGITLEREVQVLGEFESPEP